MPPQLVFASQQASTPGSSSEESPMSSPGQNCRQASISPCSVRRRVRLAHQERKSRVKPRRALTYSLGGQRSSTLRRYSRLTDPCWYCGGAQVSVLGAALGPTAGDRRPVTPEVVIHDTDASQWFRRWRDVRRLVARVGPPGGN